MIQTARVGRSRLNRVKWNLTFPLDVKQACEEQAQTEGRSANYMVEQAVRDYLKKVGKVIKPVASVPAKTTPKRSTPRPRKPTK